METQDTLFLTRSDVSSLLSIEECMDAVENVFGLYAKGRISPPKVLALHNDHGGIHIKAGIGKYFVAKLNANFPENSKRYSLPTIQGVIVLNDAENGRLLALFDSIELTIVRTGAATGIAAKWLSNDVLSTVTICGCGNQGSISLKAILKVRTVERVFAFDLDENQIARLKAEFADEVKIIPTSIYELPAALQKSNIVVTCTTSKKPFVHKDNILPGTFVAAVGADNEDKQEIFSSLIASNKLVTDFTDQCASIGELHHAIKEKRMAKSDVYAELGEVIAGNKSGRTSKEEIIVFDSTGTALQDVAAATIVYEKALTMGIGTKLNFAEKKLIRV